ncbi:methionyl-tRNA formyltransferase [Microbacterium sp. NPDC076911]|uniref:methionyl-tRNA formyltransferase n=1 Tax=Microbacterium sp. NPDC076911 TaxID=3154958 RepID=UPI003449354C
MRLVFAGTPEPAVPSLELLAASRHEMLAAITRRDAPVGRKRVLTPSPVAHRAEELDIDVIRADKLDTEVTAKVEALAPDLGVIVAYGGLVREPLLSMPRHGWINLHFSLLPKWRGAAPVQHALIAGDTVTGASVFQLVAGLDAGDVYDEIVHEIEPDATAGELLEQLAISGASLLARVVDDIAAGTATTRAQTGDPSYASKLEDVDGQLIWTQSSDRVLGRFRGVTPAPGAHTTINGARVKVLEARTAPSDAPTLAPGQVAIHNKEVIIGTATVPIQVRTVQPAGKGSMRAADWFRGLRSETVVAGS